MIGNDIVDLKHMSETVDWKRPRFLDKVFSQQEQSIIFSSENQHQMIWKLWSMKESAYKAYIQEFGQRFFNPKVFQCKISSLMTGSVFIKNIVYFTRSVFEQNYVYSTATKGEQRHVKSSIFNICISSYAFQSQFIKEQLVNYISCTESINRKDVMIVKNDFGVPRIVSNSGILPISISLTHCGNYCGFSILNS